MKKIILIAAVLLLSLCSASAQKYYDYSVGLRTGGEMAGVTARYKIDAGNALEAMFSIPYDNGFNATLLYEWTYPIINQNFSLYYGAGGHIGSWDHRFSIGIDAIVGMEFKVPRAPIAFSLDYKPMFNIASKTRFEMADVALGVRITF